MPLLDSAMYIALAQWEAQANSTCIVMRLGEFMAGMPHSLTDTYSVIRHMPLFIVEFCIYILTIYYDDLSET